MRKIIAVVLVAAMLAACSVCAFAETNTGNNTSIPVEGQFTQGQIAGKMISVDITWEAMTFTYVSGNEGQWVPDRHEYTDVTQGYWTDTSKNITVTNHSNTSVEANFVFAAAEGTDITGQFTETSGTANDDKLELETAVNTAYSNAPSAVASFKITGGTIEENRALGTITVAISSSAEVPDGEGEGEGADDFVTITDLNGLMSALNNGGSVKLGADITGITSPIRIENAAPVTFDLNGHKLSFAAINGLSVMSNQKVTIIDSVGTGLISNTEGVAVNVQKGEIEIRGGSFDGASADFVVGIGMDSGAVITNGSFIGGSKAIVNEGSNPINISGCNFNKAFESENIAVTGGTFNFDPDEWVDGSVSDVINAYGKWTVQPKS
ncbi:MAG: hypothetical protein IKZ19_09480 [Clostridia bacterium]|nr:hypothetical protein [Clostridia bacterium]